MRCSSLVGRLRRRRGRPGRRSSSSAPAAGRQASFMGEHDLAALATLALAVGLASSARAARATPVRSRSPAIAAGRRRRRSSARRSRACSGSTSPPPPSWSSRPSRRELRLARRPRHVAVAGRRDRRNAGAAAGRARLSPVVVRAAAGDAGRVRGELEPAADLRVRRRPRLPRPAAARHRLARRAAAGGVRPLPAGRARAVPGPAAALLPARRRGRSSRSRPTTRCSSSSGSSAPRSSLVLAALAVRSASRPAPRAARAGRTPAYVPAAWLAALVGALAGAALFGGSPLDGDLLAHARRRARGRTLVRAHPSDATSRSRSCT